LIVFLDQIAPLCFLKPIIFVRFWWKLYNWPTMEKERLSRRHFLILGLNVSLFSAAATVLGKRLYPFIALIAGPEKETIIPEVFQDLIESHEVKIFSQVEGAEGHKKVSLNKKFFSKALYDVASFMLPENGPEKLHALLTKRPLNVEFDPSTPEPIYVGGDLIYPLGIYVPYTMGGPRISFFGEYFQGYLRSQFITDLNAQAYYDQMVLHEIVHLIQDIKNPFNHLINSYRYKILRAGGFLHISQNPDIRNFPSEIEAEDVSAKIIEKYLEKQSLGQFFNFT